MSLGPGLPIYLAGAILPADGQGRGAPRAVFYARTIRATNTNDNNNGRRCKSMSDKRQNDQDVFLNYVRKNKVPVTVFLVNGVKLQGVISSFDNFCVLLRRDGHVQLVYKHAISTVMPAGIVQLFEPAPAEEVVEAVK